MLPSGYPSWSHSCTGKQRHSEFDAALSPARLIRIFTDVTILRATARWHRPE
jgi:hypothetical protein